MGFFYRILAGHKNFFGPDKIRFIHLIIIGTVPLNYGT